MVIEGVQRLISPPEIASSQRLLFGMIGALILPRALKLLKKTVDVLLESTPAGLDLDSVGKHILELLHTSQCMTSTPAR